MERLLDVAQSEVHDGEISAAFLVDDVRIYDQATDLGDAIFHRPVC